VERLDADVRAIDAALEQAPEVLQPVRVDLAFGVALRVVDDLMDVLVFESAIRG
jgi:hypothetical protein